MRAGGGHEKGASFERLVCEKLSRWIDPDTNITHMWRSSQSGGRMTIRRQKGKGSDSTGAGDLSPLTVLGHGLLGKFTIECKHVKNLNITSGLLTGKQELAIFWRQASRDAAHANKRPLLIAKQNTYPPLALLRSEDYHKYFDLHSEHELLRMFKLGTRPKPLSLLFLDDLLKSDYKKDLFDELLQ